jgi:hypothetical protein
MVMISKSLNEHHEITLILIAFLILGGVYSTITPIFEAPDEIQHYFHVKHIADGKGLPVLKPQGEEIYEQEGGQPSLYYLIGALATFWINTNNAEELLDYNPYVNLGVPSRHGNKNVIIHTDREGFPYRDTTLAVHLVRYVSLLFGAVTVLATYLLALLVFSGQRMLALGAAMLTAFNPKFIFTNAAVNNDGLITALCSLALLLSVLLLKKGPSLRRYVGLGVVVGLAALTKLTGLGLLAVVLIMLLILALRHSPKEAVKGGVIILGLVVLLAGWWYVRNWVLYQDLTGMSMFFEALGGPPARDLTLSEFVDELEGLKLSYWAIFGWFNILVSPWVYRFFDLLVVLGIVGLPLALVRGLKKPLDVPLASLLLMLVWISVVAAGYVRYNLMIDSATGRLVFPAISCFSIILSWGLVQIPSQKHAKVFVGLLGTMMLLVAVICPFLYIAPVYAKPIPLSDEEVEAIGNQTDINFEGQMRLLGYELEGGIFKPGEFVYLTLYWQGLTAMDRDYSVSLVLLAPNGDLIGQEDSYPGLGAFPTSFWRPGEVIADRLWVRIRPRTSTPTIGWLGVSLYHLPTMEQLMPSEGGQPVEQVFLEAVKIIPWQAQEYVISQPARFNLANKIDLIGYDLNTLEAQPGDVIYLTLYWQASEEMDQDYTVFTHLIDGGNHIWAQRDNQPLKGDYPTSFWDEGEVVKDQYEIALPSDILVGEYLIEVGLYLASTGERLLILDDTGQMRDNRVLIEAIEVIE